ncbi:hypothetical protein F4780DRAFT_757324 [Xylariomycetidae sp. FL0641]|nr:hypothetical protein F4780DRAFT_757324 [Xylariomycetidae sp. FL0641]
MESQGDVAVSPTKENDAPRSPENKSPSPTRSNTTARGLSWQRRPPSQGRERSKSRPLSVVAAENAARTSITSPEPSPATESVSKDQIASALSSKDPSWFRQTPDRGANSAAYRRSQVEDDQTVDVSTVRAQLPGMSHTASDEPPRPGSSSQPSSPAVPGKLSSPDALANAPTLDPPMKDSQPEAEASPEKPGLMSPPPLSRTSTADSGPVSPTKGLGGFVQSAMMKRSDSVSKRWSVTSPPGLQRVDTVASPRTDRSSRMGRSRPTSMYGSRPTSMYGEALKGPSRPGSSQGKDENHATDAANTLSLDTATPSEPQAQDPDKTDLPVSPSKTMDSRRWSPTKASWLESALNKPESPKVKAAPQLPNQPAWMAEIQKAKAERASNPNAERTRSPTIGHKHQVSIGGLMRSSAPGTTATPPGSAGLHKPSPSLGGSTRPILDPPGTTATPPGSAGLHKGLHKSSPSLGGSNRPILDPPRKDPEVSTAVETEKPDTEVPDDEKPSEPSPPETKPKPEEPKPENPKPEAAKIEAAKPEAAPKMDFRANLRSRAPTHSASGSQEPEFKNVFGNLRRTTTQNWVAPDELKGNILRGKAALNVTGGPKKTERVDEFKEAILSRKKEFQQAQSEGRGVTRNDSVSAEAPVPEGLARRNTLGRNKSISAAPPRGDLPSPTVAGDSRRPSTGSAHDSAAEPSPGKPERSDGIEKRGHQRFPSKAEARPGLASRNNSVQDVLLKQSTGSSSPQTAPKEPSAPVRVPGKLSSNLANRFNPALAGLLARGPPGAAPGSSGGSGSGPGSSRSGAGSELNDNEAGSGPKLTHMTKGRARGPRRKAPTGSSAPTEEPAQPPAALDNPSQESSPSAEAEQPVEAPKPETVVPVESSKAKDDEPPRPRPEPLKLAEESKPSATVAPAPATPVKTHITGNRIHEQVAAFAAQKHQRSPSKAKEEPSEPVSRSPSPRKLDVRRMSKFLDDTSSNAEKPIEPPPLKRVGTDDAGKEKMFVEKPTTPISPLKRVGTDNVAKEKPYEKPSTPISPLKRVGTDDVAKEKPFEKPSTPASPPKSQPRSPPFHEFRPHPLNLSPKKPTPDEEAKPVQMTSPRKESAVSGPRPLPEVPSTVTPISTKTPSWPLPEAGAQEPAPAVATPGPKSPQNVSSARSSPTKLTMSPTKQPMSPTKQSMDTVGILSEFFGPDRPERKYHVDTAEILLSRPALVAPKNQTLSTQLFQLSAEGKKVPVPAHNERTLFEHDMYLCAHTFKNEAGKKVTEVYFWAGDDVPTPVVEDASIFANREARAMGGKLIKLRQGKETSEFMQALGGIIVTQRGTGNKYDSLAPHMLCGRRFYGQVVFDEVDFTPKALCSGFPYLISQGGRCYIWKGKGSGVDELSCARLIGMDFALTGEMEEIEEGREPATFWDIFDGTSKAGSADHWRLKPNYEKYCSRLFCSDAASKQQIVEMAPFAQGDMIPTKVYVIDAFFELYIVVGAQAKSQYASFHNALEFAQEYAILAAGMEDRPFVPVSTVVLEGVPKDMKSVFRKWRDELSPTITNVPSPSTGTGTGTGLRRGRSLKIVSLNQALKALSE